MKNKPVMCEFRPIFEKSCVPLIEVNTFPCECQVLVFEISINNQSLVKLNESM